MGYTEGLVTVTAINVLLALGLYWTVRTGQVSAGHAGFLAIGAYLSGYLTTKSEMTLIIALVIGGVAAAVLGLLVGAVALRFEGLYLAVATLAFGEIVRVYFLNSETFGGASGQGGMMGTTTVLAVGSAVVVVIAGAVFDSSTTGKSLLAVGQDAQAAELLGLRVTIVKIAAFACGAFIAGWAGGLYAHYVFFLEPTTQVIGFERSILILMMVILGGTGSVLGPILGGVIFSLLPEVLRSVHLEDWRIVVYSVLIAAVMALRPEGIVRGPALTALVRRTRRRTSPLAAPGGHS